ncbi:adenylate/guanylate cyclase domain-containing protein [Bradyrhizobium sp. LHD-71]|uniref:CHASE2 domain-containing protein n=1 Tax=Bradyrhizobium sp. LHD-71 TaxID=3072141 RepID=UPI00280E74CF|nr:adenylate/guanylate cyclase domain-containing protein [Bradyrhizobium sp. LHD-71]MDQ8727939.1 adenylate/guanylate cyclase domain-containing protein [Bradyrhizobium sp. LHD-71]
MASSERFRLLVGRGSLAFAARLRRFARSKHGRATGAALVVLTALTWLRAESPRIVTELQERTFDAYQRLQPRSHADFPVRIVDIDEASIAAYGQWPWPRTRLATITNRLAELGAGAVAFAVIFPEPDRTTPKRIAGDLQASDVPERDLTMALLARLPDHDTMFAEAMAKANAVLGFAATRSQNDARPALKAGLAFVGVKPTDVLSPFAGAVANLPLLDEAAAGVGGINLSSRDRSGVVRRIPMLFSDGERIYPSLAGEALRVAQGQKGVVVRGTGASGETDSGRAALLDMRIGDFRVPLTDDGEAWLYYDRDRPERYVSVKDLLDPAKEATVKPRIDGAIVLVGTSAAGLADARATPLGQIMPGVAVHAQLIEQILGQDFISRPDWANGLEIIGTVLLAAFVAIMLLSFGAQFSFIAGIVALTLAIAGSWFAFSHFRLLLDPIYPSLAAITMYIAIERTLRIASDKEKQFVRQAFGQYLAPELLARLESSPQAMQLGGEAREITVMFMDVRGFTPISEALSATELVDFINTLLSPLSEAIQGELGTIDKYIGDSIMAFWNAPLEIADHPVRACRAALKMREVVKQLNANDAFGFADRGIAAAEVKIGVGLNFGIAAVGNMGSEIRFNYSAMGDVVNVSARIEAATKSFGTDLLVSEEVARVAKGIALLEAGEILLKGKSAPTKLYALAGDEAVFRTPQFIELSRFHGQLLQALAGRDASGAAVALAACRPLAPEALSGLYDHFGDKIAELTAPAQHGLARVIR